MNLSKIRLPNPIVPNIIAPEQSISTDIVNHIDQRLIQGKGLFVVDFTGKLNSLVCARLPMERATQVFLFDLNSETYTLSSNFLISYPDETSEQLAKSAVDLFRHLYGRNFTAPEAELLELAILILEAVKFQAKEFWVENQCILFLLGILLRSEFIETYVNDLWDETLKSRWLGWNPTKREQIIKTLVQKCHFFTQSSDFTLSSNNLFLTSKFAQFDVAEVHRSGKIVLISIPQQGLDQISKNYLSQVFFSRFSRSAPAEFPLEESYFFNYSGQEIKANTKDVLSAGNFSNPKKERILRRYTAMRHGRKKCFVKAELKAALCTDLLEKLEVEFDLQKFLITHD